MVPDKAHLDCYQKIIDTKRDCYLSGNFRLSELVATKKRGIDNWPKTGLELWHLHMLCINVLQPIRNHFGRSVMISSGYRCKELNAAIGGATNSAHQFGRAADFEINGVDNKELATWIYKNLSFRQLILEFYQSEQGTNSGWVHCEYYTGHNIKQFLTAKKKGGETLYEPAVI